MTTAPDPSAETLIPMHAWVRQLLQSVPVPEAEVGRAAIALAKDVFAQHSVHLRDLQRQQLAEPLLFLGLCVAAARLKADGLTTFADQLIALARIGLSANVVDTAVNEELALRRAAESLKQPKNLSSTSAGIAPRVMKGLHIGPAVRTPKKG